VVRAVGSAVGSELGSSWYKELRSVTYHISYNITQSSHKHTHNTHTHSFTAAEKKNLFTIVSAILWLGNLDFAEGSSTKVRLASGSKPALETAAGVLCVV
jgi:myosin heavy subunit